jgi:DHA1 family tetracycline resistance protein-like MFS transporter
MAQERSVKKLLIPVFVTVFIDMLGATIVLPVLAPLLTDFTNGIIPIDVSNFSENQLQRLSESRNMIYGFLIAIFPFAQFFGAPLLGAWADKVGRKRVLLLSLVGTFVGYVLFSLGVHYSLIVLLFVSRALDGFTGGNISIAFSAVSDVSKPEEKAKNFGLVSMAFGLGFVVGPVLGGVLSSSSVCSFFSFETPFIAAALLCILNIILVRKYFFETLKEPSTKPFSALQGFYNISKAFRSKQFRILFIVTFLGIFGFSLFTQFLQIFFMEKFNYSVLKIGLFFGFVGIWIAITQGLILGQVRKKLSEISIVKYCIPCLAVVILLYVFPNQSLYLFFLAPFVAIFQGLYRPNLQAIISNTASAKEQGEILGINQSVQSLAMTIPPIIAGFIVSLNVHLPIIFASIFTFLAFAVFIIFYKK